MQNEKLSTPSAVGFRRVTGNVKYEHTEVPPSVCNLALFNRQSLRWYHLNGTAGSCSWPPYSPRAQLQLYVSYPLVITVS